MLQINTSNQEKILEKYLKEKEQKTKSYKMLEESEGGIKFLFDKAPFFTSIMWLMYRVEAKENTINKIIAYGYDYDYRLPNNFQYIYLEYFLGFKNPKREDLMQNRESINDFISCLTYEIDGLEDLLFGFDRYSLEGEVFDDSYMIIDDEFRERVILPLTQGKYDEVLKREVMKLVMKENLKMSNIK